MGNWPIKNSRRLEYGPVSWESVFGGYCVLNLGFGWDRTQNFLWSLDHGELDNLHPGLVVIEIGTDNTSETSHARINTAAEIIFGIAAICERFLSIRPILCYRPPKKNIIFTDTGQDWLAPNGDMLAGITSDLTHPTEKGYRVWASAISKICTKVKLNAL